MKKLICLFVIFSVLSAGSYASAEPVKDGEPDDIVSDKNVWSTCCDDLSDAAEHYGVEVYRLSESEAEIFYGDEATLQRNTDGQAFVVYSVPYVLSFSATAYHWNGEDFEPFKFELSRDGDNWHSAETEFKTESEEGKWTKAEYEISEITEGYEFVKILWPENPTSWTPVLGEARAEFGEAAPHSIVIKTENYMSVPRFDIEKYSLEAVVYDQLGKIIDSEIIWDLEFTGEHTGIEFDSSSNTVIIDGSAASDTEFIISACVDGTELSESINVILRNFVYGDFNGDFIIDETDLSAALENYLKNDKGDDWNTVRYLDINGDGLVNVIDIAYIARQITVSGGDYE